MHRSMRKAEHHIEHLVSVGRAAAGEMRAYACPRCPGFHVGHKSRQQLETEGVECG